jgi:hypothetical protein
VSLRVLLAIVATALATGVASATAQAANLTDVAMYSDTGDWIGQGQQQVFTPANSTITLSGNAGDVSIAINSPDYTLEFAAPQGQTLQAGIYDGATRAPFRSGLEPGIDINGESRGCNTDQGRFEIKDIHIGPSGVPDRLWLVYEQHCEGGITALFGEVRINEPADAGSGSFVPGLVRWPVDGPGVPETVVPVQFFSSSAGQLGNVSLGGSNPGDFAIREDDCGGQVETAGSACDVYVRFTPTAPGLRTATLNLTDSSGTLHAVPLQGWSYGGTTRLVMNSDSGDWIGGGQNYNFTTASHEFAASGDRNGFSFSLPNDDWTGSFHPPQGDIFTAGTTYDGAQRDAFRGSAPGMEVDSPGRGCNTVTGDFKVLSATFATDGTMQTFAIQFDQYCEGAAAGLHGEFDWREGDTTPRAPWMGPGGPCSPSSCSGSSTSSGGSSSGSSSGSGGGSSGSGSSGGGSGAGGSSSASSAPSQSQSAGQPATGAAPNAPAAVSATSATARLRALKASIKQNDQLLAASLARLRRNPRNATARAHAVAALGALARDLSALRQLLVQAAPAQAHEPQGRRVLGAFSTLSQILRSEQHALASHGAAGLKAALHVAYRNAAAERKALSIIAAA